MISLGGIQSGETVDEISRIDFVHIIEVEVHGDQESGASVFCQGYGFHAVKIADDILFISPVIVSAVDGEEHGVAAGHSFFQAVIETAVPCVIYSEGSQLKDKPGFFVASLAVRVKFFMGGGDSSYLYGLGERFFLVDLQFFDGCFEFVDCLVKFVEFPLASLV